MKTTPRQKFFFLLAFYIIGCTLVTIGGLQGGMTTQQIGGELLRAVGFTVLLPFITYLSGLSKYV